MAYRINYKSKLKNKFNAKRTEFSGRKYDSKMEAGYAETLEWRKKAGELTEIIPQFKIDIRINGKHWRNYYIDFKCLRKDGIWEYHEVKGFATEVWKMKWGALVMLKEELLEPGAELIVIKK